MISKLQTELPDHIIFLSTGEEVAIQDDVYDVKITKVKGRTVRTRIKSSSATYIYIKVPQHEKCISKKLNSVVDLSLEYVQRLNTFGLIKFKNKNEDQA